MTNFAQELSAAVADGPDRPAVRLDDLLLTYAFLDAGVARAAGFLRSEGVGPGDRVGLQMPNVPYFPVLYFGALRLGAVVVPMNPLLKTREVAYHLSDSGAKVILAWHGFAEAAEGGAAEAGAECVIATPGEFEPLLGAAEPVEEITERADDDPAVIIYTSGTTGTPKGATLTHANLAAGAETARDLVDADEHSVTLATLPLFHVFGMNSVMNASVRSRGQITLLPRFDPAKALELIQRDKGSRTTSWARRSPPRSRSRTAPRPAPTRSARSPRSGSPRTSTRAACGSSTSCRRAPPARCSSASSRCPRRSASG